MMACGAVPVGYIDLPLSLWYFRGFPAQGEVVAIRIEAGVHAQEE